MPDRIPHIQMDMWPPSEITIELLARASRIPDVQVRESRMAFPATSALVLAGCSCSGPAEAFIDGREFCHLLPPPEGGIHLTLPPADRIFVLEFGWGERHPVARAGLLSPCLMTLYAPRDHEEVKVALRLIENSWRFAKGTDEPEAFRV